MKRTKRIEITFETHLLVIPRVQTRLGSGAFSAHADFGTSTTPFTVTGLPRNDDGDD